MANLRALFVLVALAGFFLVGTPLQWLIARRAPSVADRIPLLFCRCLLWILRVRLSVAGARVVDRPTIIVSNHVSWIDILALGAVAPFCFLAKREVSAWPVVSAFAAVQGTVFVDRGRRRTILDANRGMAARLAAGRSVLLFPEGTTRADVEPGRFHSSHYAAARDLLRVRPETAEVAVQPVAIRYSSPAAAWVGADDLLSHLWRTLRAPPLECTIAFAPPLAYVADSDRKLIAVRSRAMIAELLARAPSPVGAGTGCSASDRSASGHSLDLEPMTAA